MERPISFKVGQDDLFGILHVPDVPEGHRPDLAVLFVHSGSRGRLGCTFHYPFMARELARRGYPVLRYDPPGLGDSTGTVEVGPTQDFYCSIQSGRYLNDTLAAIEELRRLVRPRNIVLLGVCGGAITALGATAVAEKVAGAALLSVPVMLDFSRQDLADRIPAQYARKYFWSVYRHKLFSASAWWRLLTLQSEVVWMREHVAAALRSTRQTNGNGGGTGTTRLNPHFIDWLDTLCQRQRRVLFIFGEDDRFRWEFENAFYGDHWRKDPLLQHCCTVQRIPHCNHMLTMREWQQHAVELVGAWLDTLHQETERRERPDARDSILRDSRTSHSTEACAARSRT